VKDYVDTSVSTAITSVYKVKGSVATYEDLPSENLTEGDVYNVVAAYGNYPAGTNWVWVAATTGETPVAAHWDALGGTIDLSPYLLKSDFNTYKTTTDTTIGNIQSDISSLQTGLSTETTNRKNADSAIEAKIGGSYDSTNTVAKAISDETTARQTEDSRLNGLIQTHETAINSLNSTTGTLRSDLDAEITRAKAAEAANSTAISNIDTKIGGSYDSTNTVTKAINDEATLRTNGDNAINAKLGDGVTSENTVTTQLGVLSGSASTISSSTETNAQNIATINQKLGDGFTTTSTVTSQLATVKTTADNAVQSITVKNTATNGITATEDGTTHNVELDFDNMVIDCGTY
jgi:chromosome segregation ATPase